jgi:hypothetical protein
MQTTKATDNKSDQGQQAQCEKDTPFHFYLDIFIEFLMKMFTTSIPNSDISAPRHNLEPSNSASP